jgi:hypothetical protein
MARRNREPMVGGWPGSAEWGVSPGSYYNIDSTDGIERRSMNCSNTKEGRADHPLSDRLRFLDLCLRKLIGWIVYGQQIGVDQ